VGKSMYEVLGIERMNYEDLGNWGMMIPAVLKMHLHFMGRAKEQTHPDQGGNIYSSFQGPTRYIQGI